MDASRADGPAHGSGGARDGRFDLALETKMSEPTFDPTCLVHGKKLSEHACLFCCLCFSDLKPEECNVLPDGTKEDVCKECAAQESKEMWRRGLAE